MNLVKPVTKGMTNNVADSPRRSKQKVFRPTELIVRRPASATPYNGRRHADTSNSTSAENVGFSQLKEILLKKSGVLCHNFERIIAKPDDFIDEGQLGAGTCGVVKKMRHKNRPDLVMAVKQMYISSTCAIENKRIMMDLDVVTKCVGCPNIVKCMGIFYSMSKVWICMEVMSTSLDILMRDTLEPFPEYVLGKIAVSIVKALDYLKQEHNMMHRDVKPSNMLLSFTGDIKLCDFGISGQLKDSIANSNQLGCIGYMAPERLEKFKYDVRADIWSLGISLVELAIKSFPYKGSQFEFAILSKIIEDPPPTLPSDGRYSADFRHFVDKCLIKDYVQRPKYPELRKTNLFLAYDRQPFDVGDWYRTVRFNPTAGFLFEGGGGGSRLSPISPASSTVTLSPDGSRSWLDEEGHISRRPQNPPIDGGGNGTNPLNQRRCSPAPLPLSGSGGFLRSPTPPRKDSLPGITGYQHHNHRLPPALSFVSARNNVVSGGSSSRSQTLPPPGASLPLSSSPPNVPDRPTTLDIKAAKTGNQGTAKDGVVLRNRGRPRLPTGRKLSEASSASSMASTMAPTSSIFASVDPACPRRNPFYPPINRFNEESSSPIPPTTTTLQAFLDSYNRGQQVPLSSSTAVSPPLFYSAPRQNSSYGNGISHHRPSLPQWNSAQSPSAAAHPQPPISSSIFQDGSQSPRPPRSVSASGYASSSGGGGVDARKIHRAPACRLGANPYEATRVGTTHAPIYSFSPSKRIASVPHSATTSSSSNSSEETDGAAAAAGAAGAASSNTSVEGQDYHHQYFYYSHKPPPPTASSS